jgi:hypothetical protein
MERVKLLLGEMNRAVEGATDEVPGRVAQGALSALHVVVLEGQFADRPADSRSRKWIERKMQGDSR